MNSSWFIFSPGLATPGHGERFVGVALTTIELQQALVIGEKLASDFEALSKLHGEIIVSPRNF
jgi:hypothetical protein